MSAEEHFKKEWGTGFIDASLSNKKGLLTISMEDIYDTMESYAREYHAKEMERKLEDAEKMLDDLDVPLSAQWLLNHLKEPKTKNQ